MNNCRSSVTSNEMSDIESLVLAMKQGNLKGRDLVTHLEDLAQDMSPPMSPYV